MLSLIALVVIFFSFHLTILFPYVSILAGSWDIKSFQALPDMASFSFSFHCVWNITNEAIGMLHVTYFYPWLSGSIATLK